MSRKKMNGLQFRSSTPFFTLRSRSKLLEEKLREKD
jgi:hypothetical protein